ncbi:trigger factor [Protofrankia symbiont of Coriaria ruscifolia]|uniref:trigger factor n=1 Tax=Protofrankia symbiont of Coriaria ruscifolia TaxID=1306542 RepID=UPI00104111F7|nr:trigger factor [Protofrankia symbiont of Coriaria ruscifolia]
MKATKETLSPTRVKLTVEVPFDELKSSVDAAYRKLARDVRVSGFRPGKVPPRILDQRLGRGTILEEAINSALPRFYTDAVRQEEVDVLSPPEVGISSFSDGAPLVFTAEVDVRPDIALPDYDGLEVTVDATEVTEEQLQSQLTTLRERFAVLKPVERPVQAGDFISLDLSATVDGEAVEGADATGMSYEVGSGDLVDGLDEAVTGASEGESRTFQTELLAGEYAGSSTEVTVTIRGVKERELPELDDDFATTASEFDSLEELLEDVRERLDRGARLNQFNQARERILDSLIEWIDVPVPESVLDSEVEAREHRLFRELERLGLDRDSYLESLGQTEQEYRDELRQLAAKALRSQFILDTVINAEQIGVEQGELMEQVIGRAQRAGLSPEVFAQQISQGEGLASIMADTLRGKALNFLLEQVKVVDAEGNAVELALPRRPEAAAEADDAEADDEAEGVEEGAVAASADAGGSDARGAAASDTATDTDGSDAVAGDVSVSPAPNA